MDATVLNARERFLQALRSADAVALEELTAEDFTFVDPESTEVINRDSLVRLVRTGGLRFESIQLVSDQTDDLGPDEARFRSRIVLEGKRGKNRYSGEYRLLELYRRNADGWQVVLSSASPA